MWEQADRLRGVLGIVVILGVALLVSDDRRAISKRVILWGIVLQWVLAVLVLRVEAGQRAIEALASGVTAVLDCAIAGAQFVFGSALVSPDGPVGFVFAFRVLPTVIFISALSAVLYHLGIMQWIVRAIAWLMKRFMGTSGAESLNVAASIFMGQTEAPLTIRPYVAGLTRSELLTVMVSGMASVSGGILAAYLASGIEARHLLTAMAMTAPSSVLLAKLFVPETGRPLTFGTVPRDDERPDGNVLAAAARGTTEGLTFAFNIAAMLIAFIGLVSLVDLILGAANTSLRAILGVAFAPVAWLLGTPQQDCRAVGGLLGTRLVLNELVAFGDLGALKQALQPRSFTIASFALCGFANIASIGIQIGGIGALAPERRGELARLGPRALVAATLANFLSAAIAGLLIT